MKHRKSQNLIKSDEKLFNVETAFSHQNERVQSISLQDIAPGLDNVKITQKPASVMVHFTRKMPLIFVPTSVKINKEININIIIEGSLLVWVGEMYIQE